MNSAPVYLVQMNIQQHLIQMQSARCDPFVPCIDECPVPAVFSVFLVQMNVPEVIPTCTLYR